MSTLHVYANDVKEWFVATSRDEAITVARAYLRDVCGVGEDEMDLEFDQEPDDKMLRITTDGLYEIREQTCAAWAKENGVGFLCSTEF